MTANETNETNETKASYLDGEECTELFHTHGCDIPASWARQESNEAARMLTHEVLGMGGTPMEGGNGSVPGWYSLAFQGEADGLGYTVTYRTGEEDELGFVKVENVRVYRDARFDRKEGDPKPVPFEVSEVCDEVFEDAPAITFATAEEYEVQCERMEKSGVDDASRAVWETVKADAEDFWKFEERIRDRTTSAREMRAKSHNRRFAVVLDTYKKAFEAMGCHLTYVTDWSDPCERIHTVRATGIYGNTLGCLHSYGHDNWLN